MVVREKREFDSRPVILKFGAGLAISLGGILFAFFKSRSNNPPQSKLSQSSPGCGAVSDSKGESDELEDGELEREPSLPKDKFHSSGSDLSSDDMYNGDRENFLLPEFGEHSKECNIDVPTEFITLENILETHTWDVESPKRCNCADHDELSREIQRLRSQVEILEERERYLEVQLLEYYGLKEQETAIVELQNRLRINNTEAKLYNLKIESLESEKGRLEAQVTDYANVVAELEAAKAKIMLLRKKLRFEAKQNREQILSLQERVMKLQDEERKAVEGYQDEEMQRHKMKELEELEKIKNYNHDLKLENSELAQKLECLQMLATSVLGDEEAQDFKEENYLLRKQNKDLEKKMEQLQTDRCTDLEELVYLRWINACLRYELRNYQPSTGKAVARDLSKTLSPISEARAKQLIIEYANNDGSGMADIDSDQWSTFQASLTDSGEPDDYSPANAASHSGKMKVFAKLIKLLRGKDSDQHIHAHPPLEEAVSVDDILGRYSSDSHSVISEGLVKTLKTSSEGSSCHSLDLQRSYSRPKSNITCNSSRRTSEDGSLNVLRTIDSITKDVHDLSPEMQPYQEAQNTANTELVKYAEALKNSGVKSSFHRRSAPFSSF